MGKHKAVNGRGVGDAAHRGLGIRSKFALYLTALIITVSGVHVWIEYMGIPFTRYRGWVAESTGQALRDLVQTSDLREERLLRWIEERHDDARTISGSGLIRANVQTVMTRLHDAQRPGPSDPSGWRAGPSLVAHRLVSDHLRTVKKNYGVYDRIDIVDVVTDRVAVSTEPDAVGDLFDRPQELSDPVHLRGQGLAEAHDAGGTGEYALRIYHPIVGDPRDQMAADSGVIAVLVMVVSTDDLIRPLLSDKNRSGGTGLITSSDEVLLVDDDLRVISPMRGGSDRGRLFRPLEYVIEKDSGLGRLVVGAGGRSVDHDQQARVGAHEAERITSIEDQRGEKVVAVCRRLKLGADWGWWMIVKRDRAEIMAPLWRDLNASAFPLLLAVVFGLAAMVMINLYLTRPILELNAVAQKIAGGNLRSRVQRVGTDEVGQTARAFNAMADNIQTRHGELERQVALRTAELERVNCTLAGKAREHAHAHAGLMGMLDHLTQGFVSLDTQWRYTYVNERAAKMFGREVKDLIGKYIWAEFPEGVGQPFYHAYYKAVEEQATDCFEDYYAPWDRWFENHLYPSSDGLSIFFQDVTERKLATEALADTNRRIRVLTDLSPVGIYRTDADGHCVYVNPMWVRTAGISPEAAMKDGWATAIHPDDRQRIFNQWYTSAKDRTPFHAECRFRRADGSVSWVLVQSQAEVDEHGGVLGYVGTVTDITDRKAAEAQIRHLNEDLERRVKQRTAQLKSANTELEAFSYSVSHDLRATLRSISGFSQALLEDYGGSLDRNGRDYLNRVCDATKQMKRIIDDLLKLSRISGGEVHREPVDLSNLARSVVEELRQDSRGREVVVLIEDGLVAQGDARLLRIALANLIGNAWKFTGHRERARIEFGRTRSDDQREAFYIRDDGAGFDMAYSQKLFRAFQRLHSANEFEGTGVGLATVRRVVQRHGGRIWAESAVDEGSTFYFSL